MSLLGGQHFHSSAQGCLFFVGKPRKVFPDDRVALCISVSEEIENEGTDLGPGLQGVGEAPASPTLGFNHRPERLPWVCALLWFLLLVLPQLSGV